MLRTRSRALSVLFLVLFTVMAAAACGGGEEGQEDPEAEERSGEEEAGGSEAEREAAEAAEAAEEVPEADRVAYYQLSITSGALRASLVAASLGEPTPTRAGPEELERAARTVRRVEPSDRGLGRVRAAELAMLARVHPPAQVDRAEARSELRRLDRINAALSRFLRREPAQAVLVPD